MLGVAFSRDGKLLASAGGDGDVLASWNPVTGHAAGAPLRAYTGPVAAVKAVAFGPDGTLLASADGDGTVRLWNPRTGAGRGAYSGRVAPARPEARTAWGFSPYGTRLGRRRWT